MKKLEYLYDQLNLFQIHTRLPEPDGVTTSAILLTLLNKRKSFRR